MTRSIKSKKPVKRKISRKQKKSNRHIKISVIILIAFAILISLYAYRFFTFEIKAIKETSGGETKNVPQEVANNLKSYPAASYRIPVLLYHYVEYVTDYKDSVRVSLNINPDIFEEQIKTLHDAGFTFLTVSEVGEIIDGRKKMPPNPVVITFDDGHWDNATVVLPILKKYNARATFYIVPGLLNGSDFLTTAQVKEIVDSGRVEIGSHTVHHISLANKLSPLVTYEVVQSKKMLEEEYKIRVYSFAYPNGDFDQIAIDAVKAAGYTTAVSTVPGIVESNQNRYFLFRLRPGYRVGPELINHFKEDSFRPFN